MRLGWVMQQVTTRVFPIVFVFTITWGTLNNVYHFHDNWKYLSLIPFEILNGHAPWRAFQNRLLGPWLVFLISKVAHSKAISYQIFISICLLAENSIIYVIAARRLASRSSAYWVLLVFNFIFIFLEHYWLYPWDMLDILLFTWATYVIVFDKGYQTLLVITLVASLNRESALFVALGVSLTGLDVTFEGGRRLRGRVSNIKVVIYGLVACVISGGYAEVVRNILFRSQPDGAHDAAHAVIGNHFQFFENVWALLFSNFIDEHIALNFFLWAAILYTIRQLKSSSDPGVVRGILFMILQFFGIMAFARLYETRVYYPLLATAVIIEIKRLESSKATDVALGNEARGLD